jgi:putative intracellular protease/amidase
MHVAVPLYPGYTALDAVGPYTVLAFAPGWTVTFVAAEPGPVPDDQRDHRDEQVQGDHQGKVLAVDLVEPPDGFERERHPRAPLKSVLIPRHNARPDSLGTYT